MATDTQKYAEQMERETRHSALEEFSRDERRPAVLLLSGLVIAALFFAFGLLVGRWTARPEEASGPATTQANTGQANAPATSATQPATINTAASPPAAERRFTLLVATYDTAAKAEALVKALEGAGHKDVRTSQQLPRGGTRPVFSVFVGRYTREEANEAARRMLSTSDPRLKNAKVVESSVQ
jgi:hypothetical protein